MRVHRFQSPFRHWVSGLSFELVVFAVFMAVVAALSALIAVLI